MANEKTLERDFWLKSLSAIANGAATAPLFAKAGIVSNASLLAFAPAFGVAPAMVTMLASTTDRGRPAAQRCCRALG